MLLTQQKRVQCNRIVYYFINNWTLYHRYYTKKLFRSATLHLLSNYNFLSLINVLMYHLSFK